MNEKSCLMIFRNKKINIFDSVTAATFASNGIYFDRVEFCAFDDSEEITRSIRECKGNYANIVMLCPRIMLDTVKDYCGKLFGGKFDNFNILQNKDCCVYAISTDGDSRLKESDVVEMLTKKYGQGYGHSYVRTVGASLTEIDGAIAKAKELCPQCDFNVSDSFSDCCIEIVYPDNISKSAHDNLLRMVIGGLNDHVYALENIPLAQRLFQLLQLRRMKISVAESFTGGGISKRLVEVSGISEVYFEGLNTYSNESKVKRLGVDELTLKQYGAVSEQTAYEMAEGLLNTRDCDIAVATTGIAGPKSDSTSKPVGLLYIAVGTHERVSVYKYQLKGSREKITETAINFALFHVFKALK